jgi:ferredoxin-NADP reductase/predicted pyridoxine 5'-phosphate oxidase superfamily flavin-nucleotide-binding protein
MSRQGNTGAQALNEQSPFHEGEQQVQIRLGVREDIEPWARRVVRPFLPEEHRAFHTSMPFLVAAARDGRGRPWATLLSGPEGFVRSPDPEHLTIDARPVPGDALESDWIAGAELGLLGIDLATRRRNRVNGQIAAEGGGGLVFKVGQAFGNCPQYIHERAWQRVPAPPTPAPAQRAGRLSPRQQEWIRGADTFFVASGHRGEVESAAYGMDASHRGGDPGFVKVESEIRLVFPDYAGNNHYNTLGNLVMDPRAGLLFVDFERGSLLQLTGRARIDWDSDAVSQHPGARRLVYFDLEEVVELVEALPLRWSAAIGSVRSLRLIDKVRESDDVTSFVFAARDGAPLPDFEAGQHLPVELDVPGREAPVARTYSLSNGPGGTEYRISVKREPYGLASGHLHGSVEVGAIVDARAPAGDFVLRPGNRPVVLLSAGVGLTPLVSMLHALADPAERRPVWFIHAARDGRHHAMSTEVRDIAAGSDHIDVRVAYSRPRAEDELGRDYDVRGRVDGDLVAGLLPDLDAEFYLCGPKSFLSSLSAELEARGVPAARVHAETFGPTG